MPLQRHFTYVHPRERMTRKLWNFENYFLPSQTHLPVVIMTAGILSEVIVLLRKLLGCSGKFVITICNLYMLYLCAQVHIAWFDREYIYIYRKK